MNSTNVPAPAPAPSKKQVQDEHERIVAYFTKDYEQHMLESHEKGHRYLIQNTVHSACRELILDKHLVIFVLMGSNSRRATWGTMKDNYDMEPASEVITRMAITKGQSLLTNTIFTVEFVDSFAKNGDFRMKVNHVQDQDKTVEVRAPAGLTKSSPAENAVRRVAAKSENTWAHKVANSQQSQTVRAKSPPKPKAAPSDAAKDAKIEEMNEKLNTMMAAVAAMEKLLASKKEA